MGLEILYYTDSKLREDLAGIVRKQIKLAGLPITSVSLKPLDFGKNIVFDGELSYLTMFKQILTGLKAMTGENVFMCEHDVLYHSSHFDFTPPKTDVYYYNSNVYKYRLKDRRIVKYDCKWLSQLCANRQLLIQHYEKKIKIVEAGGERKFYGYEPGTGHSRRVDRYGYEIRSSQYPNIDIRHGGNLSGVSRMKVEHFKNQVNAKNFKEHSLDNIPGWDTQFLWSLAS